jgi:hypothetical protein
MMWVQLKFIMVPVSFLFQHTFFRLLFLFLVFNFILFSYGVPYYLSRRFINRLLTLFFVFYFFYLLYYFLVFLFFLVFYFFIYDKWCPTFLLFLNNFIFQLFYPLSSRTLLKILVSLIVQICIFFFIFPRN